MAKRHRDARLYTSGELAQFQEADRVGRGSGVLRDEMHQARALDDLPPLARLAVDALGQAGRKSLRIQ